MENHLFIDRFFHSQYELLDINNKDRRDSNTLYTFLNNLHSTGDRLKDEFDCDIKIYPEFKILRLIRNYFHHVGDVNDVRFEVYAQSNVITSHSEHLIIPLETYAKSVKSFIDNNLPAEGSRNYANKLKFVTSEMAAISEINDYTNELLRNLIRFCDKPSLKLDGVVYELGFDIYKYVYNIANIVADKCREIELLKTKKVIIELDSSYTAKNNIGKYDVISPVDSVPITTTKGFVYPKKIEPI